MKAEDLRVGLVLRRVPDDGWRGVAIASNTLKDGVEVRRFTAVALRAKGGTLAVHGFGGIVEDLILDPDAFEADHGLWERFHEVGFTDMWYPSSPPTAFGKHGPGFYAGIWTGPQSDLISVKRCATNEEGNWWLSPAGWTPEEATELALKLLEIGPVEFDKKYPGRRSRVNLDNYVEKK